MPAGASPKREREYKQLKSKFKKEKRYKGREEEVASRIVNKQRRQTGETKKAPKKTSSRKSSSAKSRSSSARKTATRKTPARKSPARKSTARKSTARKTPAKRRKSSR